MWVTSAMSAWDRGAAGISLSGAWPAVSVLPVIAWRPLARAANPLSRTVAPFSSVPQDAQGSRGGRAARAPTRPGVRQPSQTVNVPVPARAPGGSHGTGRRSTTIMVLSWRALGQAEILSLSPTVPIADGAGGGGVAGRL